MRRYLCDKKKHDGQMIPAFTFRFQNSVNLFELYPALIRDAYYSY